MSSEQAEIEIDEGSREVALRDPDLTPTMVSDIPAALARLRELQEFVREVMEPGEDYGAIPGSTKKILFKPGAEKLCEIYGYAPKFEIVNRIEDWDRPLFHYEVRCDVISKRTGRIIGQGVGSCNTREDKYRWREAKRRCPQCGAEQIIKGKEEFGGGWLCWRKQGGCGAKFGAEDPAITAQPAGRVENEEVFTLVNTCLKMAAKRALVDATLRVTRSSGLFTQDEEVIGASGATGESSTAEAEPPLEPPRRKGEGGGKMITQAQADFVHMRARNAGVSEKALHAHLKEAHGVAHVTELPAAAVNLVLKWLEEQAARREAREP